MYFNKDLMKKLMLKSKDEEITTGSCMKILGVVFDERLS